MAWAEIINLVIAFGSLCGGVAAAISAEIARRSMQAAEVSQKQADRDAKRQLWSEIQSLGAKAEALIKCVERVKTDLVLAYEAYATFTGNLGNSRLQLFKDRAQSEFEKVQERGRNSGNIAGTYSNPSLFDYEAAADAKARLEAHVIHISNTLDILKDEFSVISQQVNIYQAQAIIPKPPNAPVQAVSPKGRGNRK